MNPRKKKILIVFIYIYIYNKVKYTYMIRYPFFLRNPFFSSIMHYVSSGYIMYIYLIILKKNIKE